MLSKCAQAVQAAAQAMGRAKLTDAQIKSIDDRLSATMRQLARKDPAAWRAMTEQQRLVEATQRAVDDIQAEAALKAERAKKQVAVVAQTEQRVQDLQAAFKGTRAQALKADMNLTHQAIGFLRRTSMGDLAKLIDAAGDKQGVNLGRRMLMTFWGAENPQMTRDIAREIFANADGATGNKVAQAGARAWLDVIEGLRQRFNNAGGDVGKLEYGYLPNFWNRSKIHAQRDAFAELMMPLVDRSSYLKEDGSLMSDAEVWDLLNKASETISTNGMNMAEPGAFKGTGARASRGADPRVIHFKDGDSWIEAMRLFGRGSMYDAMMGHIGGITRDIGLVERYGPDIQANARLQFDLTAIADGRKPESLTGPLSIDPHTYWNMITGKTGAPVDESLAQAFKIARNIATGAKLGSAVISSVTDLGTLAMTAGYNRLPYWQIVKDIASQTSKDTREWMSAHGMIAESAATELNRWSGDHLGNDWSGKIANGVMRLSLMNAWTDGLRQGFTMTMNAGLARMAKMEWGKLSEFDRVRLQRAGITEADWGVLNTVAPEMFKGRELLTPQAIRQAGSPELAAKVFGFIHDESEYAIVNPDLQTRAISTMGGQQAGTWGGEIARCVMQFKSFPIAMYTRHWARMLDDVNGTRSLVNRSAYGFALMATLVGLGAVALQEKQLLRGQDPIDMNKPRFWVKALTQGGGLGILGDLFLVDPAGSATDMGTNAVKNVAGPVIGTASELLFKDIAQNAWEISEGKDSHALAELASFARNNTPSAANVWWVRPLVDHGFMNALNEAMSPGYLAKQKDKAYQDWGTRYWWQPGEALPDRAPDFAHAVGQ